MGWNDLRIYNFNNRIIPIWNLSQWFLLKLFTPFYHSCVSREVFRIRHIVWPLGGSENIGKTHRLSLNLYGCGILIILSTKHEAAHKFGKLRKNHRRDMIVRSVYIQKLSKIFSFCGSTPHPYADRCEIWRGRVRLLHAKFHHLTDATCCPRGAKKYLKSPPEIPAYICALRKLPVIKFMFD